LFLFIYPGEGKKGGRGGGLVVSRRGSRKDPGTWASEGERGGR